MTALGRRLKKSKVVKEVRCWDAGRPRNHRARWVLSPRMATRRAGLRYVASRRSKSSSGLSLLKIRSHSTISVIVTKKTKKKVLNELPNSRNRWRKAKWDPFPNSQTILHPVTTVRLTYLTITTRQVSEIWAFQTWTIWIPTQTAHPYKLKPTTRTSRTTKITILKTRGQS